MDLGDQEAGVLLMSNVLALILKVPLAMGRAQSSLLPRGQELREVY